MQISANGLHEIELSEGFSSKPYWDSIGGVWTIGFGETRGVTHRTAAMSRTQAESKLKVRFSHDYAPALAGFVGKPGFTQNMYDALGSFIWNCGTGAVSSSTTVGHHLRAGRWHQAADALLAWDKAQGVVVKGLRDRRERERALFLKPGRPINGAYLTPWERATVKVLADERAIAKRHGGWAHVDDSHLRRASRAKADLRARVHTLQKSGLSKSHRRERVAALNAVID
jgi:lysozyme